MSAHTVSRPRRLLLGGIAVPAALVGSMLGATSATAANSTETTKAGLVAAFQAATNGSVITLGADLVGDGGASDVVTVPSNRSITLDLNGHRLDLDRLVVGGFSNLFIGDATGLGADLTLGGPAALADQSAVTGAAISSNGRIEVRSGVRLVSVGSPSRAGVGTVAGSDTNALLYIDDGATVEATGGAHGAGIGGGEGAAPLSTISIGHATVTATGGAGAAAIGGGYGSTGTGSAVSIENGDVTLAGTIASTFGSFDNLTAAGGTSTLTIAAGSTLTVPAGQTLRSTGDLVVRGTLTGSGTIDNPGGTIRQGAGGSIADRDLTVTGRNHAVTLAAGSGTTTAPAVLHVYATTLANAGLDLTAYTGSAGGKPLVGWTGSGVGHVTNDDLLAALSTSGGESDPVTLTAAYETLIAFTAATLPNAATGQRYERQAPVSGDATRFDVTGNPASGLPTDTIPAFPVGLAIDGATGAITGQPTTGGHYSFVLTASSPHQRRAQVVTIDIAGAPVIATGALPDGTAGTAYSTPILATSESGAITYSISGGALPDGLLLDRSTGVLAGTPTSTGTATFIVAAANAFGTTERTLSVTVDAAAVASPTGGSAGDGGSSTSPSDTTTNPAPGPAAAPVLPILATTTVKLGHPLLLSIAATSTVATTYSVPAKDLPAGITLDSGAGLLVGAPRVSGRFLLHITARSSAGTASRTYVLLVPAVTHLVTGSASAVTPRSGTSVVVTIRGLRAGERWRVALNGHQVSTGIATFGGSVKRAVRLPARSKDTKHRIRVSGDRRITDPSTVASHEVTVTAVIATKSLRLTRSGRALTMRGLAAKERVTVRRGRVVLATGRADAHGVFVVKPARLNAGAYTVTGSTKHRTDRLVVR